MRIHTSSLMGSRVRGMLEYRIYPGASTINTFNWVGFLTENVPCPSWLLRKIVNQRLFHWYGKFSLFDNTLRIRKVYNILIGDIPNVSWKGFHAKLRSHLRVFFAWQIAHGSLTTRDRIATWGLSVDPSCPLCNTQPDLKVLIIYSLNVHKHHVSDKRFRSDSDKRFWSDSTKKN